MDPHTPLPEQHKALEKKSSFTSPASFLSFPPFHPHAHLAIPLEAHRPQYSRPASDRVFGRCSSVPGYPSISRVVQHRNHFLTTRETLLYHHPHLLCQCRYSPPVDSLFVVPYLASDLTLLLPVVPHVGHLHSVVLADTFKRFHELKGQKAIMSAGTDEHGLKVCHTRVARKAKIKEEFTQDLHTNQSTNTKKRTVCCFLG